MGVTYSRSLTAIKGLGARVHDTANVATTNAFEAPQAVLRQDAQSKTAEPCASRWTGFVWGALLLLTIIIPWGFSGGRPIWSWLLFKRWPLAADAMLVCAWSTGLLSFAAALLLRGLRVAAVYLVASAVALAFYLIATHAEPTPWLVFIPINTDHRWVQALAVVALAWFLVATGIRVRHETTVAVRAQQLASSLTVLAMGVFGGIEATQMSGDALGWSSIVVHLLASALMALGGLLSLLTPGTLGSAGKSRVLLARRMVLLALLLLFAWGLASPTVGGQAFSVASHAYADIPKRLNGEILTAGLSVLAIEGLIGVAACFPWALTVAVVAMGGGVLAVAGFQANSSIAQAPPTETQRSVAAVPKVSESAEWSQWCGRPDRNMVSEQTGLPDRFDCLTNEKATGLSNVRWVVALGQQAMGSPVVSGGKVFVGGQAKGDVGALWCFRESDGHLLWRMWSPYPELLYNHYTYGICSTPTVEGDCLYLLGHLGDVLCLNTNGMARGNQGPFVDEAQYFAKGRARIKSEIAADGSRIVECSPGAPAVLSAQDADILWRFDMLREAKCWPFNAVNASVLIKGERLYVATGSVLTEYGDEGCGAIIREWKQKYNKLTYDSPALIVLDKHSGKLLATDKAGIFERTFHGAHASPTLGTVNGKELLFYGAGDGACYAFDPDFSPGPNGEPGELKMVWKFDCLDPASYATSFKPDRLVRAETIATPVSYKNRIYTSLGNDLANSGRSAGPGRLVCIDATQTGDITRTGLVWSLDDMQSTASTVAIADGLLYTGDAGGTVYCLDADTGKVFWTHKTAPVWSSPLVADGKVYVGTHLHGLLVFAHGREAHLLSENMGRADIVASPAVAHGVLYVATQKHLYALELGKSGGLSK
jgi:outer membrane protein assembly factor BamB